jgi:hypothetical protein
VTGEDPGKRNLFLFREAFINTPFRCSAAVTRMPACAGKSKDALLSVSLVALPRVRHLQLRDVFQLVAADHGLDEFDVFIAVLGIGGQAGGETQGG